MSDNIKGGATIVVDDAHMAADPESEDKKPGNIKSVYGDSKIMPHNMDHDVTASVLKEALQCPRCGKLTLHAEFPDQYEAWVKCSSCGFFMGMSNEDWHRMENSPNIDEKIKKMAEKKKE